jgi:hypothetical protein
MIWQLPLVSKIPLVDTWTLSWPRRVILKIEKRNIPGPLFVALQLPIPFSNVA